MRLSHAKNRTKPRANTRRNPGPTKASSGRGVAASSGRRRGKEQRGQASVMRGRREANARAKTKSGVRWPRPPKFRFGAVARPLALGLQFAIVCALAYGAIIGSREAYEYATTSPRFEARSLIFEPTPHVSDRRLRELLALESGTNILALDLEELRSRILVDPWVRKAEVTRMLPDTLGIRVTEHRAKAVILAEHFYLVDDEGVPFKRAEGEEALGLPIITGIDRELLAELRDQAVAQVNFALGVLSVWNAAPRPEVGEIHLGQDGGLVFYLADTATQLRLGRGDSTRAMRRFDEVWNALGDRAEELAVAHLDGEAEGGSSARVVVRFHPKATVDQDASAVASTGPREVENPGDSRLHAQRRRR